jgi:hypothetical protein
MNVFVVVVVVVCVSLDIVDNVKEKNDRSFERLYTYCCSSSSIL